MIKEFGRSVGDAVVETLGRAAGRAQETASIGADLLESEAAYLVRFDAPGARASDVQVRYRDGRVEVRVDRFRELQQGYEMRYPGRGLTLEGEARLPDDATVDPDAASATLGDDGILEVRIPRDSAERSVQESSG